MMTEVEANLSFGVLLGRQRVATNLRRGDRIEVDIHDPQVRALVQAGYLKIVWKERVDAGEADRSVDPAGAGIVPGGDMDRRAARPEAQVDGQDKSEPAEGDRDSPPPGRSARSKNS